jgi:hypothetical protein
MKRAFIVILLIAIFVSSLATNLQPVKGTAFNGLFSDDFNGIALDTSKWVANQNVNNGTGGSITVANSSIYLTSLGTSFPQVYTAFNPFPTSGDFAVEFDIEYTRLDGWGTGLWISKGPFIPASDVLNSNIMQVWAHYDETGSHAFVMFFGKQVYNEVVQKNPFKPWGSSLMIFRLQYSQGIYILYLNGTVIASEKSSLRADTIGFGHPPIFYVPMSYSGSWTSFRVGSISFLQPSSLSIYSSPNLISDGNDKVDISGKLTDIDNVTLANASVVLSYQIPNLNTWTPVTSVKTDAKGNFETTWFVPATGTFLMKAEWVGDSLYSGTLQCKNISVTRAPGESLFFAESNSTLSSLAFNSTSKEISFTVSGQSGTTGYVRFLVSKTLMDNVDFKVYLDGNQLECNTTSEGNFLSLYFQYHHSTHIVLIKLPTTVAAQPTSTNLASPSVPELPSWIILPAFLTAVMLLTASIKRKRDSPRESIKV